MSDLYEHLTTEVLNDFKGSGNQALLELILNDDDANTTSVVFTEVLMRVQEKLLSIESVVSFLHICITDEQKASAFCLVFDVFPLDDNLKALFNEVYVTHKIITPGTLAKCVDSSKLSELEVLPAESFNRQMNTRKRDQYFTQKKFNLVHEEFEGFSILINEFHSIFNSENSAKLVDYALSVVLQLIGHYLLDPNRVLDVILDLSSNFVVGNVEFLLAFLKKSSWWPHVQADSVSGLLTLAQGGCVAASSLIALRILKQSKDRDLSETFKALICILIKEGFISFGSVYTQIAVSDDEMDTLQKLYQAELDEKVFRASASALSLAAPLSEEGDEDEKASAQTKKPLATLETLLKHNVKFQLLKSLLSNGLYWPSIYILSEYPFLAHVNSEVSALMHRLLGSIIDPLHRTISLFDPETLAEFQKERQTALARPLNQVKYESPVCIKVYCFNPLAKLVANRKYIYFYENWNASLPELTSAHDLHWLSEQYLKFFGPTLASDSANLMKICDIIISDLRQCALEEKERWFNYFRNYIFPTIGFIQENAICVDKAYEVLKFYSVEDRFNLYGELHQVLAKSNPYVKLAYGKAEKSTKDVLKRLLKENVKPMMMKLAKISISNPLPCFLTILQQLESYDNLNALVVKTAAYFNDYGWDNLVLAIMMRLTTSGRSGVQQNGLNDRQWIQSLSSFIGKICQEYSGAFDLTTLSKYLLRSLHSAGTSDLIVLKEMLSSMGGLQAITNLTHLQISMINSEPCLEKIVYETIGDCRYQNSQPGSAICNVLMKDGMVNEFFVLLCKLNSETVVGSEFSHLKVLASKKDEIDSVTHLLCTLVGFFLTEENSTLLPITDLIQEYNIPIPWAFEIWRKFLSLDTCKELSSSMRNAVPESTFDHLDIGLFLVFWSMSLYDINFSDELYKSELAKLVSKVLSLKEEYSFARRDKNTSTATLDKIKKAIEETQSHTQTIPKEQEHHREQNQITTASLKEASSNWFDANPLTNQRSVCSFLENCVLPRSIHSSFDAIYSATAIFKLHEIQTSHFSVVLCLNQLLENKILFATLFTCTVTEAENLGLFVSAILKKLGTWSNSETFGKSNGIKGENGQNISFDEYRAILFKYHSLILDDVKRALTVTTYMSRMNAITFLKNLMGVYPIVEDHCEQFIELMENITKMETRDDLKLSSSAMIGHVKSRKAQWVHLWDFMEMEETEKAQQIAKREKLEAFEARKAKEAKELQLRMKQEEAKKARELQDAESKKKREEEKARLEKEKAELQRQATVNAIKYEDSTSTPAREVTRSTATSRGDSVSKDRYQSYASNGFNNGEGSRETPRNTAPSGPSSTSKVTTKPQSTKVEEDLFQHKSNSRDENRTGSQEGARSSLLKAKLEEAKREETARKEKEVAARNGEKTQPKGTPEQTPSGPRTGSNVRARPPLPPQRAPPTRAPPPRAPQPHPTPKTSSLTDSQPRANPRETKSSYSREGSQITSRGGSYKPLAPRENSAPEKKLAPPAGPQARARPPLPPQRAPKEERYRDPRQRNERNYDEKGNSQRNNDPLPPPPLPPPGKREGVENRKRRFESSGREYDKRQKH